MIDVVVRFGAVIFLCAMFVLVVWRVLRLRSVMRAIDMSRYTWVRYSLPRRLFIGLLGILMFGFGVFMGLELGFGVFDDSPVVWYGVLIWLLVTLGFLGLGWCLLAMAYYDRVGYCDDGVIAFSFWRGKREAGYDEIREIDCRSVRGGGIRWEIRTDTIGRIWFDSGQINWRSLLFELERKVGRGHFVE